MYSQSWGSLSVLGIELSQYLCGLEFMSQTRWYILAILVLRRENLREFMVSLGSSIENKK